MSVMTDAGYLQRAQGAPTPIRSGHFVLTSGRHSDTYVQCARILEDPAAHDAVSRRQPSSGFPRPATSISSLLLRSAGSIIGFAVAQALGVKFIFSEREKA